MPKIIRMLSAREQQVIQGVMEGETAKQTAKRLGISEHTVASHRRALKGKLKCQTLAQAVGKMYQFI